MRLRRLAGSLSRRVGIEPSPFVRRVEASATRQATSLAHRFGFDLRRQTLGSDLHRDLKRVRPNATVVFDVGANVGQSIKLFKLLYPEAEVHSFEPDPAAYAAALEVARGYARVEVNSEAVAAECSTASFSVYSQSDMNSFLPPGTRNWASVAATIPVTTVTIDRYCGDRQIESIDVLKTDTQGFDLEVLRGAEGMLRAGRIGYIVAEMNFCDLYKQQASPAGLLSFMEGVGYEVVSFYNLRHRRDRLGWLDALWGQAAS